jgi:hypothetical protein
MHRPYSETYQHHQKSFSLPCLHALTLLPAPHKSIFLNETEKKYHSSIGSGHTTFKATLLVKPAAIRFPQPA